MIPNFMRPGVGNKNLENREEWLEKTLLKIPENSRILDAGAGELRYKKFCTHLDYVSQDFGQYNGQGNGAGLHTQTWDNTRLDIVSDITAIPLPDASFDAVMCIEVFEHIPQPVKAIEEFARLTKPNGYLVITAPFCSLTHFAPYHFYTGYNTYFYEKHLAENNFKILEIERNGNYFEYIAQEIWRVNGVAKKYANRRTSFAAKIASWFLLRELKKLSKADKGSAELLCYGINILAQKNVDK